MGRTLLVEVEGFVDVGTTIEAAETVGRDVEVPEARAVTWAPRAWLESA
jgi:hypothetical protein